MTHHRPLQHRVRRLARHLDRDRLEQAAVVLAAVGQLPAAAQGAPGRGSTASVEEVSNSFDVPVVPANYAFAVWGPLYAGSLALARYQALPTHRSDPLLRAVRLPFAAACAGNAAWVPLFTRRKYGPALGAILTTLTGATLAHARTGTGPRPPGHRWLVQAPAAALSGWISLATPSSITIALLARGHDRLGLGPTGWGLTVLGAVSGVAAAVTRRMPSSPAYPATVVRAWSG